MRFSFSQYLLLRLNWKRKKKHTLSRVHYLSIRVYFYCSFFIFHNMLKFEERYGFFPSNKRSSGEKSPRKKNPKQTSIYLLCLQLHTAVDLMMMIMMIILPISLCSRVYRRFSRNIRAYILFRHRLSAFHFKCIMCLIHSSGFVCSSNTEIYLKHHSPSFFHIFFLSEKLSMLVCV